MQLWCFSAIAICLSLPAREGGANRDVQVNAPLKQTCLSVSISGLAVPGATGQSVRTCWLLHTYASWMHNSFLPSFSSRALCDKDDALKKREMEEGA